MAEPQALARITTQANRARARKRSCESVPLKRRVRIKYRNSPAAVANAAIAHLDHQTPRRTQAKTRHNATPPSKNHHDITCTNSTFGTAVAGSANAEEVGPGVGNPSRRSLEA